MSPLPALLTLMPVTLMPVLLVAGGVAMILGLVAPRALFGLVGGMVLWAILGPVVHENLGAAGPWVGMLLMLVCGLAILRGLLKSMLGGGVADHVVGRLTYDLLRLPVRMMAAMTRLAFWALRNGGHQS